MAIDIHSQTWKDIKAFLEKQRADAIELLISDKSSDKQRGAIDLIDKVLELPAQKPVSVEKSAEYF